MRKIWLCLLLLALLGTLLSGCMRRVEAQGYDVYYVEQSAGAASAGHASSSAERRRLAIFGFADDKRKVGSVLSIGMLYTYS